MSEPTTLRCEMCGEPVSDCNRSIVDLAAYRADLTSKVRAIHPDGEPCVCVAAVLEMIGETAPLADVVHYDSSVEKS